MPLPAEVKQDTIAKFAREQGDTGSPEVQIAILTERIKQVAVHLREHKQDVHNRRGLRMMVSKRNKLLRYLQRVNREKYQHVVQALGLRK